MSVLTDAKLILTPNAYKASKLYSLKPFDGSGDFDVVRATTAWRRNESGIWESVANNVPRLHYPVGGGCPSCLVEPQRTNETINSVLNGSVTSPLAAPTSWGIFQSTGNFLGATAEGDYFKLGFEATSQRIVFQQNKSFVAGEYWYSFYAQINSFSSGIFNIIFVTGLTTDRLLTYYIDGVEVLDSEIPSIGLKLISVKISVLNNYSGNIRIGIGTLTAATGNVGVYLPQLEQGTHPSSRILTTTTTVTRNADIIDVTTPAGVTEIVETFSDGSTNTETIIPATYQLPQGEIKSIVMT
jgi:hypothetical protein